MDEVPSKSSDLLQHLADDGWQVVDTVALPERVGRTQPISAGIVGEPTARFLNGFAPKGLYGHQHLAIKKAIAGSNVCIATGTASGKSLVFYAIGIEHLARKPDARLLVTYPLKALAREQEERWRDALELAGLDAKVGRIDGQVPSSQRLKILRNSQVLIATPDILHAWLLSNLGERSVSDFISSVSFVVVDEVHTFTGVFGSNAAYLFRRLRHLMSKLSSSAQYMAASATIARSEEHLRNLFGLEFELVESSMDTSPRYGLSIHLLRPPGSRSLLTECGHFLRMLAGRADSRFVAFVDSRKQTEHLASIVSRFKNGEEKESETTGMEDLSALNVLPYRSGYEMEDRDSIQDRLRNRNLQGVVSTSALELGIDIPHLDVGVLIGVPRSQTSLLQRIGRVGRHSLGDVFVITTGDVFDEAVFREPSTILKRPLAEGALYLENQRIQYIHALCLARPGGEDEQICAFLADSMGAEFSSPIAWPEGFVELCKNERTGEVPLDLQQMKSESGDDPNHVYPLRDVESQFKVELKQGPVRRRMGSLSYSQVMREAYPGAVYYYATQPNRVYLVKTNAKQILVRREKRFTTRQLQLPTLVFPNLTTGNVYQAIRHGELTIAECNLQIRESVSGYKERRGSNEFTVNYPLDSTASGQVFNLQRFTRNYFTSGVVLTHPALSQREVNINLLSILLFESFLMVVPYERNDINFSTDKFRIARGPFEEGKRFLALYDQTYGSLRLTSRLLESGILGKTLHSAEQLAKVHPESASNPYMKSLLSLLSACLRETPERMLLGESEKAPNTSRRVAVIGPGGKGLDRLNNNEEFEVESVFFSPAVGAVCYRGRRFSLDPKDDATNVVPVENLIPVEGESSMMYYDLEDGTLYPS